MKIKMLANCTLVGIILCISQSTLPMVNTRGTNAIVRAKNYVINKTSKAIATSKETYTNIKEIMTDMKQELTMANAVFNDLMARLHQTKNNLKDNANNFAESIPNIALAISKLNLVLMNTAIILQLMTEGWLKSSVSQAILPQGLIAAAEKLYKGMGRVTQKIEPATYILSAFKDIKKREQEIKNSEKYKSFIIEEKEQD